MLPPDSPAPDFKLPDQDGHEVCLGDLLRGDGLVLYFYPADFTPVCTAEACLFRDRHGELLAAGYTLAGVSPQRPESHARFRERHNLSFALLSDPQQDVIAAYQARGLFGIGVRRATYFVRPDRTIGDAVQADLGLGPHNRFVTALLARTAER